MGTGETIHTKRTPHALACIWMALVAQQRRSTARIKNYGFLYLALVLLAVGHAFVRDRQHSEALTELPEQIHASHWVLQGQRIPLATSSQRTGR